jgi:hypothetical protein
MHGGTSPSGVAHPRTIHGRYSKDLPQRLAERFHASQADPDLLNLKAEIALLDARLAELVERIDIDGAGSQWNLVAMVHAAMNQAIDENDMEELKQLVDKLGMAISRAVQDQQAWTAIGRVVEQRRKLVETEGKRRVAMQDLLDTNQALMLITAVTETVKRHVHDRDVLARIGADLRAIMARDGG